MVSSTSVLGSKNVIGVHCVAPERTNYFYKDVNVSFHCLLTNEQQLLSLWNPSSDLVDSGVRSQLHRNSSCWQMSTGKRKVLENFLGCRDFFFTIRTIAITSRLSVTGHVYIISPTSDVIMRQLAVNQTDNFSKLIFTLIM